MPTLWSGFAAGNHHINTLTESVAITAPHAEQGTPSDGMYLSLLLLRHFAIQRLCTFAIIGNGHHTNALANPLDPLPSAPPISRTQCSTLPEGLAAQREGDLVTIEDPYVTSAGLAVMQRRTKVGRTPSIFCLIPSFLLIFLPFLHSKPVDTARLSSRVKDLPDAEEPQTSDCVSVFAMRYPLRVQ